MYLSLPPKVQFSLLVEGQTDEVVNFNVNRMTKLMRTYTAQMEALNKYRNKDKERIFRLTYEIGKDTDGEKSGETPFPLGEAVRLNLENIEDVVRIQHAVDRILHYQDKKLEINHVMFADKSFFNVY